MLLHVSFASFFTMVPGVVCVTRGSVGMMGCLFVMAAGVVLGCLAMMTRSVGMMLLRLRMMFSCFLRHEAFLLLKGCKDEPRQKHNPARR